MKIHSIETVTRYRVSFRPDEAKRLRQHEDVSRWLYSSRTDRGNWSTHAQLTRSQINTVCDVLGINGRQWMAANLPLAVSKEE